MPQTSGVPDIASRDWLTTDEYASYQQRRRAPAPLPPKATEEPGDFMRNLRKTLPQTAQLLGGTLAFVGDAVGSESLQEYGLNVYERNAKVVSDLSRPQDEFTNVLNGSASAIDFLQGALGYVTGQGLEVASAALAGSVIGSAAGPGGTVAGAAAGVAGKQVAKGLIREFVENQVNKRATKFVAQANTAKQVITKEAAQDMARKALAKELGAASTILTFNLTQELGSIYPEALETAHNEGRELNGLDMLRVAGTASGAAAIDSWADRVGLRKVLGGAGGSKPLLRLAREVPVGAAREGVTEFAQTGLELVGADRPLTDNEAKRAYINAAAIGAVGGGTVGAVSSAHQRVEEGMTPEQRLKTGVESKRWNVVLDEMLAQGEGAAQESRQQLTNLTEGMREVAERIGGQTPEEFVAGIQPEVTMPRAVERTMEESGLLETAPPPVEPAQTPQQRLRSEEETAGLLGVPGPSMPAGFSPDFEPQMEPSVQQRVEALVPEPPKPTVADYLREAEGKVAAATPVTPQMLEATAAPTIASPKEQARERGTAVQPDAERPKPVGGAAPTYSRESLAADASPEAGDVVRRRIGSGNPTPAEDLEVGHAAVADPENNRSLKIARTFAPTYTPAPATRKADPKAQSKVAQDFARASDPLAPGYKETANDRAVFEGWLRAEPKLIVGNRIRNYKELVEKAYGALKAEVKQQFKAMQEAGVKVEWHSDGAGDYTSSAEMVADIHKNSHLWTFRGGDPHTALGEVDPETGLTYNDLFRAVHDHFGHSINGAQFGKNGDENAWVAHGQMFSPLARIAMSSETRGQNSWVNFSGKNTEALAAFDLAAANRALAAKEADPAARAALLKEADDFADFGRSVFTYATQKAAALPYQDLADIFVPRGTTGAAPAVQAAATPQPSAEPAAAPTIEPAAEPAVSVEKIHQLAESKGIPFDNDPAFMAYTEGLTGKRHLDELDDAERATVARALEARQPGPLPKPLPAATQQFKAAPPPVAATAEDEVVELGDIEPTEQSVAEAPMAAPQPAQPAARPLPAKAEPAPTAPPTTPQQFKLDLDVATRRMRADYGTRKGEAVVGFVRALVSGMSVGPDVVVAKQVADVPAVARSYEREQAAEASGEAPAAALVREAGGKYRVYIFEEALPDDPQEAAVEIMRSLRHEVTHWGVKKLWGENRVGSIFERGAKLYGERIMAKAREYGVAPVVEKSGDKFDVVAYDGDGNRQLLTTMDNEQAAETEATARFMRDDMFIGLRGKAFDEVVAALAEDNPSLPLVREYIAAIREFLRPIWKAITGHEFTLSDDEILRDFVLPVKRFTETGKFDESRRRVAKKYGQTTRTVPGQPESVPLRRREPSKFLSDAERTTMRSDVAREMVEHFKTLPHTREMVDVAKEGAAGRKWYQNAASTLTRHFGEDAPRFAALAASTSPRVTVEENINIAEAIWRRWTDAGHPLDPEAARRAVVGGAGEVRGSPLPSWMANAVRALSEPDLDSLNLSGSKVDSFFKNLSENFEEVTNDTWMAVFHGTQFPTGGRGKSAGKRGSLYLAMNAKAREAAKILSEETGDTWTPAEVQAAVWSWAKSLLEIKRSAGESRPLVDILRDPRLTEQVVQNANSFEEILNEVVTGEHRSRQSRAVGQGEARAAGAPLPGAVRAARRIERQLGERVADERVALRRRDAGPRTPAVKTFEADVEEREKNFRDWLGNSKVRDIWYHGTARDIRSFKPKQAGAIFVTKDPGVASHFSRLSSDWMVAHPYDVFDADEIEEIRAEAKRRIMATDKLLPEEKETDVELVDDILDNQRTSGISIPGDLIEVMRERQPSGANVMPLHVRAENPFDYDNPAHVDAIMERLADLGMPENEAQDVREGLSNGDWSIIETSNVQDALKAAGHDSFYVREAADKGYAKNLAVYEPTQLKSAVGNNGFFDPENPDVSMRRPGNRQTFDAPEESRWDNVVYMFQDKQRDLKQVIDAIKANGRAVPEAADPYMQETLFHGRAAKRTDDFWNDEFKPLLGEMKLRGVSMEKFEEYLLNRQAEETNKVIALRNPNNPEMQDGGSGVETAIARKYLAALGATEKRAYEALGKMVDAITEGTRKALVDGGLETQATVNSWKKAFPHYVPLHREDKGDNSFISFIGQGISVRGSFAKARTGSKRKVVDILGSLAQQRDRAIVMVEKNKVGNALLALAEMNPQDEFWRVDDPTAGGAWEGDVTPGGGLPTISGLDASGHTYTVVNPNYKALPNVIVTKVKQPDGSIKERSVVFDDSPNSRSLRLAQSLKNLDAPEMGQFLGAAAKVTRYFAAVNTQFNPVFGVVNLVRDVQSGLFNLSSTPLRGKHAQVAKLVPSALRGIYADLRAIRKGQHPTSQWAQEFEEFQREGGQTGFRDMFQTAEDRGEKIKSELARLNREGKPLGQSELLFDTLKNWLSDYNTTMENSMRLAAYKVAKENGMSKAAAANLAKNLTVNFNKKGQLGTQIGALYAFFNASTQGTARLAQTLAGPAGKKIVVGGLLLGAMQALALSGFDEDEPPEFVRQRSLILPFGDKYISIPMPLGLHVLPNIGRVGTDIVMSGFRDTPKKVMNLLDLFADAFNPVGNAGLSLQTIAPTGIDPLAALAENRDWTGKPIAREDYSPLTPEPGFARAKDTASAIGKGVSEGLNWLSGGTEFTAGALSPTPDQIDFLLGQVFGGVGRELLKGAQTTQSLVSGEELPTYKMPLVGRFIGTTEGQAPEASQYFNNLKRLNAHELELKGRRQSGKPVVEYLRENPDARLVPMANAFERRITQLRRQKRKLLEQDAPRERVRTIENMLTAQYRLFNERVKAAREGSGE